MIRQQRGQVQRERTAASGARNVPAPAVRAPAAEVPAPPCCANCWLGRVAQALSPLPRTFHRFSDRLAYLTPSLLVFAAETLRTYGPATHCKTVWRGPFGRRRNPGHLDWTLSNPSAPIGLGKCP